MKTLSKYTTEVRFICEREAGYSESKGVNAVDDVIAKSWNKIFTGKFPIFDENYRSVLCQKILKHFYLREICSETVGIWKLWLNERMEMIMPYYNQLYKSELIEFNPMYDVDVDTSGDRKTTYDEKNNNTRTENLTENYTDNLNTTNYDLYSDTPQGALVGVESQKYLTNARKIRGEAHDNSERNNTGTQKNAGEKNYKDINEYSEHVIGKHGSMTYSNMLNEFRTTFLNIDAMICEELNDLFFSLW